MESFRHPAKRAAGCVVYRDDGAGARLILLIQDKYGSWTLPKGHLEAGEDEPAAAVREVFAAHFEQGLEVGAAVSVVHDGRSVVDLWAGHADAARTRPWQRDTLVNVWSTTKGGSDRNTGANRNSADSMKPHTIRVVLPPPPCSTVHNPFAGPGRMTSGANAISTKSPCQNL